MKKLCSVIVLASLVLAMAGTANAATYSFGGYVDNAWETVGSPGNWLETVSWGYSMVLPGENDVALIRNGSTANLSSVQTVNELISGAGGEKGNVTVNGGTLRAKNQGNTSVWGNGFVSIGSTATETGVLTINSGTVTADRYLILGNWATLNMNGGTLNAGFGVTGFQDWDSGISFDNAANAQINMYGGVINTKYINYWTNFGAIYFANTSGKIVIDTDWCIQSGQSGGTMLADGKITAASGLTVVAETFEATPGNWDARIFAANNTAGSTYRYHDAKGTPANNQDWNNVTNWFVGGAAVTVLPGEFDIVHLPESRYGSPDPVPAAEELTFVLSGTAAATVNHIAVTPYAVNSPTFPVTLTVQGQLRVKTQNNSGGAGVDGALTLGASNVGKGTLIMNSGRMDIDDTLWIGNGASSEGEFVMNGGEVYVGYIPRARSANGELVVGKNNGKGHLEMVGGTLYASNFVCDPNGTVNFSGDAKIVVSNTAQKTAIEGYMTSGNITGAVLTEVAGTLELSVDRLLGYWDFEEGGTVAAGGTTTDKSNISPAIDLTLQADAAIITDPDRSGYVLDGQLTGTGVRGAKSAVMDISKLNTPKVFTMQAWVRPTNIEEQWASIAKSDTTNAHNLLSMNSGLLFMKEPPGYDKMLEVWRGTEWNTDGTGPWHHLLVTSDGYKFYGYVDGVLRNTRVHGPVTFNDLQAEWWIGLGTTHLIDDVAMWNGYCPAVSAAGLYNGTYTVFNVPLNSYSRESSAPGCTGALNADDPNLVAWYHLEEDTGTTTSDLSNPAYFAPASGTLYQDAAFGFDSSNKLFQPLTFGNYFVSTDPTPNNSSSSIDGSYIMATGTKYNDANSLSNGFTISAWINPVDLHNVQWGTIATKGGWEGMLHFYYENGGIVLQVKTTGGEGGDARRTNSIQNVIQPNEWTHVAGVWDPNDPIEEGTLYFNGSKLAISNPATQTTGKLVDVYPALGFMVSAPGGDNGGTTFSIPGYDFQTRTFRGGIDDVRLYNRILTDEEVACLAYRNCVPRLVGAFDGDCAKVDMSDLAALSADWQDPYTIDDLKTMAEYWLEADVIYPVY
jgi:hypothetical protein